MKKKKQRYVVFLNGDSRMGSSPTVEILDEDQIKYISLYAEYVDVYPVGKPLNNREKKKLGMVASTDK